MSIPKPLWRIGFRPFFTLGSAFAIVVILYWMMALSGKWSLNVSPLWHAHEMLYGFGSAILSGFLLTALQNWTQQRGIHGRSLQVLVCIWGAARLLAFTPVPALASLYPFVDMGFFLALLIAVHPYLQKTSRNRIFYLILGLFVLGNGLYHWGGSLARTGIFLGLYLYVLLCILIGGRIIPLFIRNSIPHAQPKTWPLLEKITALSSVLWVLAELFPRFPHLTTALALGAAFLHTLRWLGWKPWLTWRNPLLSILLVAYAWIPIALWCRGFWGARSWVTHLFTLGVMGMMMYAMMTRVALGHTGRELKAPGLIVIGYLSLQGAVLSRSLAPLYWPQFFLPLMYLTGTLWCLAFGLYALHYWPILWTARPDGRQDS